MLSLYLSLILCSVGKSVIVGCLGPGAFLLPVSPLSWGREGAVVGRWLVLERNAVYVMEHPGACVCLLFGDLIFLKKECSVLVSPLVSSTSVAVF